jgi:hypothetical protein
MFEIVKALVWHRIAESDIYLEAHLPCREQEERCISALPGCWTMSSRMRFARRRLGYSGNLTATCE